MPASTATVQRAAARVSRMCERSRDARSLRLGVLDELRRSLGFDAYAWLLTDPHTCVGAAPLADVPCLDELPRLVRLKYLTAVNRWTSLRRHEVGLLHRKTHGDLSRSLLWRELLAAYDVVDVASCVFVDRFGCWAWLDLWRTGTSRRFGDPDAELLAAVIDAVTAAVRRAQAASFGLDDAGRRRLAGPVVLLLGPDLHVRGQTPDTADYLKMLLPPTDDRPPVPAAAYNVAAQLVANEAGVDAHPPSARVHFSGTSWLTLRAARIGDGAGGDRDIAVTIEQTSAEDRLPLFAAAFGLTPRETELLRQVAAGGDTRDVAQRLFLSEHTVHDHLKSIFAKTGANNRGSLLSRALGT